MAEHSGKWGLVDGQSTIRNWTFVETSAPRTAVTSNTQHGTARKRGVKDWSGSFSQYGDAPAVMPGETFAFKGYTAPTDDVSGAGITWEGTAIVDQIVITWNWETAEIITIDVTFSGHGAVTQTSNTLTDATVPDLPETCGTKIEFDVAITVPVWTEWTELVSATLTITANNQTVINSSTANWTERKAGPIDWTLAVVQDDVDRASQAFDLDDEVVQFRLYTNATEFWLLQFGMIREFTGITVDTETGAIIRQTVNIDMNAHDGTSIGNITLPGAGAAWWP
jgi:hypothetical protein